MAARGLDEIDERLLALLDQNARRPAAGLAKLVGLSRSAVQERLARLEETGIIAGYTIRRGAAPEPANCRAVLLVSIETRPCETVLRHIRDWPEIKACYSVAGAIDAVILAETATNEAMGDLRNRLAALAGIREVTTAPVLRAVIDRR